LGIVEAARKVVPKECRLAGRKAERREKYWVVMLVLQ
jgi:hypothetical protein